MRLANLEVISNGVRLNGDYRLRPGSPCIDAGSNAAVPVGAATDLAGRPRFVDDPATPDTGEGTPPIVDIGAYEYTPPPPDFNADGAVDAADLEHFGDCATGPAAGPPADGCADADLDRDGDIDQCDFGLFQPWLGWAEAAAVPEHNK